MEQNRDSYSSTQGKIPKNATMRAMGGSEMARGEDNDGDVVAGPAVEASVVLAKTIRKRL